MIRGGNPIQETIWFGDQPVATIKGSNIYYIHSDHLNTPRAITDNNNKVIWRWDSDPFGTTLANEDPDGDGTGFTYNLRFPGQYYDQESGLHYNYFRDYDPNTGRYIQADKLDVLGRAHDPSLDVVADMGLVSLPFNGSSSFEIAAIGATPLNHSYGYVNQNPIGDFDSNKAWGQVLFFAF